jgi:DNA-binding transcriptional MerR regulator
MAGSSGKSEHAFRTIGELASDLGVPQHILRYWETRFPQLRPLQRAGNRRYYRPADVALARRIHKLLNQDGYTIRGVQQLLARGDAAPDTDPPPAAESAPAPAPAPPAAPTPETQNAPFPGEALRALRQTLTDALTEGAPGK